MFEEYREMDEGQVELYNSRRRTDSTRLKLHMGPAPYDGDPWQAKILLLLNNPTFTNDSVRQDHQYSFDGWPLAGLHPEVRAGFRNWYNRPFGNLIEHAKGGNDHEKRHTVSNRVAILQINPWASKSFDKTCSLPSRELQFKIAKEAVFRGAVVIIGRSHLIWKAALPCRCENILELRSRGNPRISAINIGINQDEFNERILTLLQ